MKKFAFLGLIAESTLLLSSCRSASLGIIGGADGPTAVFVTSSAPSYLLPALVIGALLLVGIVLLVKKRK